MSFFDATLVQALIANYGYVAAFVVVMLDNVLRPLLIKRGVDLSLLLILTGVLVATSIPLQRSLGWARLGRRGLAWTGILVALFIVVGLCFVNAGAQRRKRRPVRRHIAAATPSPRARRGRAPAPPGAAADPVRARRRLKN